MPTRVWREQLFERAGQAEVVRVDAAVGIDDDPGVEKRRGREGEEVSHVQALGLDASESTTIVGDASECRVERLELLRSASGR